MKFHLQEESDRNVAALPDPTLARASIGSPSGETRRGTASGFSPSTMLNPSSSGMPFHCFSFSSLSGIILMMGWFLPAAVSLGRNASPLIVSAGGGGG